MEPLSTVSAVAGTRQIAQYTRLISRFDRNDNVIYEIGPNPGELVDLGSRKENIREQWRNLVLTEFGVGRRFNTIG